MSAKQRCSALLAYFSWGEDPDEFAKIVFDEVHRRHQNRVVGDGHEGIGVVAEGVGHQISRRDSDTEGPVSGCLFVGSANRVGVEHAERYGQEMAARGALMAGIAKQLGHPRGVGGRMVGLALNRGNRGFVSAAVQALHAGDDAVVADVGFGGGVGLKLLLDSVSRSGCVHGVEVSDTMLKQAARRYRRDIAAGRLALHSGSLTRLPFADGTLNGVVTVNTIYFVADLQEAFTELARVTAHSGRIVIGVADPETLAKLPFTGHGFRLRPIPEVINALQSAGFTVQHRRINAADGAPHLLIGTPAPTQA